MVKKLHNSGVTVKTTRYNGVMHGFVSFYEVMSSGDQALQESAQFLNKVENDTIDTTENYDVLVKKGPTGFKRFKEEAEAFVIGAFLVGKSTIKLFIK
ncbi:hypothetical protein J2S78_001779 [Salibacterium salarium]|uniref:hypothetical protein n=1 Tax=Salibacterium salarium TaxID=284579 RepID=UPI0027804D4B|nr:hypothetical protein [Salibacterium salarium]MDQ0299359.1 hypothetical protein [Salibacterium salarium]